MIFIFSLVIIKVPQDAEFYKKFSIWIFMNIKNQNVNSVAYTRFKVKAERIRIFGVRLIDWALS